MGKITIRVMLPMILTGLFTLVVFISINHQALNASFYIILSFLVLFIFFYGLSTGQKISSPIKKILRKAFDLSQGDLKTRVYMETKDEFGELAQAFNKIAQDLENIRSEKETAEKSIDIKVKARTESLEETINALDQKLKNRTIEAEGAEKELQELKEKLSQKEEEINLLKRKGAA